MQMDNNSNTITHPETIYSHLSDSSLHSMYDESVWFGLNEGQRHDLLQETVNREAIANGNKYACEVVFTDLDCRTSGEQCGNTIYLNREMFVDDKISVEYDGKTITYSLFDSNFQAYETIMHEHQHVLQDAIATGTVEADAETKALFESNCFTTSDINGEKGSQYLLGEVDFSMYMLNPTEANAYRVSQEKTATLVSELNSQYGEKASNATYTDKMTREAYEVKLEQYKELYNNPNVEKEVANVLMNAHHNTNIPVDKNIETIVHREMVLSQQTIDNEYKMMEVSQMEGNKWADMHVSRETYDATLHSTVNSFYEHSMNDPSVSQEQAISETSQVSEGYLNAMDAFDAAQAEAVNTSVSVDTGCVDSSASADVDSGVSGGVDGGCDSGMGVE